MKRRVVEPHDDDDDQLSANMRIQKHKQVDLLEPNARTQLQNEYGTDWNKCSAVMKLNWFVHWLEPIQIESVAYW